MNFVLQDNCIPVLSLICWVILHAFLRRRILRSNLWTKFNHGIHKDIRIHTQGIWGSMNLNDNSRLSCLFLWATLEINMLECVPCTGHYYCWLSITAVYECFDLQIRISAFFKFSEQYFKNCTVAFHGWPLPASRVENRNDRPITTLNNPNMNSLESLISQCNKA